MNSLIETGKSEPKKTTVHYVGLYDDGERSVYGFVLFDKVVYIKVRYREKTGKNAFTWLLEPIVEKVGLSLDEVLENGEQSN